MADPKGPPSPPVAAPTLVRPHDEHVVDAASVTFEWEPVAGATGYRLEVAEDATFDERVFDEEVGDRTSFTVANVFAGDGRTYFWRVIASNGTLWSPGEHVESFIASTSEMEARHLERPEERLGPYPALIGAARTEVAAELGDREARRREEIELGVAHEGVPSGQIMGIALAIMAGVVALVIAVFQIVGNTARSTRDLRAAEAVVENVELQENEMEAASLLDQYQTLSAEEGRYQIPIDRAMALLIAEERRQGGRRYTEELRLPAPEPLAPEVQQVPGN